MTDMHQQRRRSMENMDTHEQLQDADPDDNVTMHAAGEHFLAEVGMPTRLEDRDREVAAGVALEGGLAPNGRSLVQADGSLMPVRSVDELSGMRACPPLGQIGSLGNSSSTNKVKVSALSSFNKFTAASTGADLELLLVPCEDAAACLHVRVLVGVLWSRTRHNWAVTPIVTPLPP